MSKVENLRERLMFCLGSGGREVTLYDKSVVDSIIVAVEAEGEASGAAKMIEYIRSNCKVIQDREYGQMLAITEDELDPSVLAPDKKTTTKPVWERWQFMSKSSGKLMDNSFVTEEEAERQFHMSDRALYCLVHVVCYENPDKESEQDNTTEEEYEDMRRNGGPGVKP